MTEAMIQSVFPPMPVTLQNGLDLHLRIVHLRQGLDQVLSRAPYAWDIAHMTPEGGKTGGINIDENLQHTAVTAL